MAKATTTIGIMNITQTKTTLRSLALPRKTLIPAWWIAWIAVLLLAFSTPAFVARFLSLPGDNVHAALLEERPVSDADLAALVHSRLRVIGWYPSSAGYNDLVLVALQQANKAQGEAAKTILADAQGWQRRALLASPVDPYGWFRLAYLYIMEDGRPSARAASAWQQSVSVAPYEPRLMVARVHMGMTHEIFLDADAKALIPRLIRGAVEQDVDTLARQAKAGNYISTIENALANDPRLLNWFRGKLSEL